jgi:hypothetical protein
VELRNGIYKSKGSGIYDEVGLDKIHYLSSPSSTGPEYALLLFHEYSSGGSSSQVEIAQVLVLSNKQLSIIQQMEIDEHGASGPYYSFNESTKVLVMRTTHYLLGDAHCCVSAMDVITLRWDGKHFVQTSIETLLTASGKREGKKLGPEND